MSPVLEWRERWADDWAARPCLVLFVDGRQYKTVNFPLLLTAGRRRRIERRALQLAETPKDGSTP